MTLNLAPYPADLSAVLRRQIAAYTGPSSYATGGDAITPNDVRMGTVMAVNGLTISNGTAVLHGWYNTATGKLMWFVAAGTEVSALTDLDEYTGVFEFIGR